MSQEAEELASTISNCYEEIREATAERLKEAPSTAEFLVFLITARYYYNDLLARYLVDEPESRDYVELITNSLRFMDSKITTEE